MTVKLILLSWLICAIGFGLSGILGRIPPPAVQGILIGLTLMTVFAYFMFTQIETFVLKMFPRGILRFHLIRFVGLYFLYLYSREKLPYDFAVPGGWGDIVVATIALAILAVPALYKNRRVLFGWNLLGLLDIMVVVVSAARLNLTRPGELDELTRLPLSLLPTFIVPLVISTHVFVFQILLKNGSTNDIDQND